MNAVYAGSFDPFTNGHLDIIRQACPLFNTIYVVIATNNAKQRYIDKKSMQNLIEQILLEEELNNKVCVYTYDGLIADFCEQHQAHYLIRGIRNNADYLYEENLAKINKRLNYNLNTIYFRPNAIWEICSSSLVRELHKNNRSVSEYVPKVIDDFLKS